MSKITSHIRIKPTKINEVIELRTIALDQKRLADFLAYCRQYRHEHDVSWLGEDDLNSFQVDPKHPTYLLLDQKSQIVGVVSLMNTAGYLAIRKSRFRIFTLRSICSS